MNVVRFQKKNQKIGLSCVIATIAVTALIKYLRRKAQIARVLPRTAGFFVCGGREYFRHADGTTSRILSQEMRVGPDGSTSTHSKMERVLEDAAESVLPNTPLPDIVLEYPKFIVFAGVLGPGGAIDHIGVGWAEGDYFFTMRHSTDKPSSAAYGACITLFIPGGRYVTFEPNDRKLLGAEGDEYSEYAQSGFDLQAIKVPPNTWSTLGVRPAKRNNYTSAGTGHVNVYSLAGQEVVCARGVITVDVKAADDYGLISHTAPTIPGFSGSPGIIFENGHPRIAFAHCCGDFLGSYRNYGSSIHHIMALRRLCGLDKSKAAYERLMDVIFLSPTDYTESPGEKSKQRKQERLAAWERRQSLKADVENSAEHEQELKHGGGEGDNVVITRTQNAEKTKMMVPLPALNGYGDKTTKSSRAPRTQAWADIADSDDDFADSKTLILSPEEKLRLTELQNKHNELHAALKISLTDQSKELQTVFLEEREAIYARARKECDLRKANNIKLAEDQRRAKAEKAALAASLCPIEKEKKAILARLETLNQKIADKQEPQPDLAECADKTRLADQVWNTPNPSAPPASLSKTSAGKSSKRSAVSKPDTSSFAGFDGASVGLRDHSSNTPHYEPFSAIKGRLRDHVRETQFDRLYGMPLKPIEVVSKTEPPGLAPPTTSTVVEGQPNISHSDSLSSSSSDSDSEVPPGPANLERSGTTERFGLYTRDPYFPHEKFKLDPMHSHYWPVGSRTKFWIDKVQDVPEVPQFQYESQIPWRESTTQELSNALEYTLKTSDFKHLWRFRDIGTEAVLALKGTEAYSAYLRCGKIEEKIVTRKGRKVTMFDKDGFPYASRVGVCTPRFKNDASPRPMDPESLEVLKSLGIDMTHEVLGSEYVMAPSGPEALEESMRAQAAKLSSNRDWSKLQATPDFDEKYKDHIRTCPKVPPGLVQFDTLFDTVVDGFDPTKSSGWASRYKPGTKGAWLVDTGRATLKYMVIMRLILRMANISKLATMTPLQMVQAGLKDPAEGFIKSEAHKASKAIERTWRIIWVNSIIDATCQGVLHHDANKADIGLYGRGGINGICSGMGHSDEGYAMTGKVLEWVSGPGLDLLDQDAQMWDLTVSRDAIMFDADRRNRCTTTTIDGAEVSPDKLLYNYELMIAEGLVNSAHCLCIGPAIWGINALGTTSSGTLSTTSQNCHVRKFKAVCCGAIRAAVLGDDLVASGDLNLELMATCGTICKPTKRSGCLGPVEFTSHSYTKVDGVWKAKFLNFRKLLAHLDLRRTPGKAPMNDSILGCLQVLRHSPEESQTLRTWCKMMGWKIEEKPLVGYEDAYNDLM